MNSSVLLVVFFVSGLAFFLVAVFSDDSSSKKERGFRVFMAITFLTGSLLEAITSGSRWKLGHIATVEEKLNPGEMYTLLTSQAKVSKEDSGQKADCYCVVLKTDNGKVYAVYVKNPIPVRGVVGKDQNGEMVFFPLPELSPLAPLEKPVEKPAEKPSEKKAGE